MKHIRILHLYSNALDLYGDYKNLTVLQRRIAEIGNTSDITEINLDEVIDPTGYDFVYIGHGKARNLAAVAPHFVQYGDTIRTAIEGGQVWFVTGNARELFGQRFTTPTGETMPGIGLFDYTGVETNKVFVSDMLAQPVYDENVWLYQPHCLPGRGEPLPTVYSAFRLWRWRNTRWERGNSIPQFLCHMGHGSYVGPQSFHAAGAIAPPAGRGLP